MHTEIHIKYEFYEQALYLYHPFANFASAYGIQK